MAAVGRYELKEELGRGGAGVVWRAHDPRLGRDVAIKLLARATPRLRQRIAREGRALARLEHPGIVKILDSGETPDGAPWVALELVRGGSLQARLDSTGPLPIVEAVAMTAAVADALAYAHALDVVHRDVKPANILLGADGAPRLGDFGLVKELRSQEGLSVSVRGQAMGTPGYFSPEQALGEPDALGPAADVYALGATLHALLTGTPPQETAHDMAEAVAAAHRTVEPPSRLRREVDAELDALCLSMLAVDPEQRPTAVEVGQRLQRWQARSRPAPRRASRGPGPGTVLAVSGALVVACLALVLAWRARSAVGEAQARQVAASTAEAAALARAHDAETARLLAAGAAEARVRDALGRVAVAEDAVLDLQARLRRAEARAAPAEAAAPASVLTRAVETALAEMAEPCDAAARPHLQNALRLAALGRPWRELEVWVQAAARAAPRDPATTVLRARLAMGRDQHETAEAALEEARALGVDPDQLDVLLGVVQWFRGKVSALARWDQVEQRGATTVWGAVAVRLVRVARGLPAPLRPPSTDHAANAVAALSHLLRVDHGETALVEVESVIARQGALDAHLVERLILRRIDGARSASAREEAVAEYADHLLIAGASSRLSFASLVFARRELPLWEPLALACLDEAIAADPERADTCYARGAVGLGYADTPAETLLGFWRKALERDPALAMNEEHLAEFRRRYGETPELRELLAKRRPR